MNICTQAVAHYGNRSQLEKAEEECLELALALQRLKSSADRVTRQEIITEVADVQIMLYQVLMIIGCEDFEEELEYKVKRLKQRLEDETAI